MDSILKDRRPIRTRQARWAQAAARALQQRGCTPNGISLASIAFAAVAGLCLALAWLPGSYWLNSLLLVLAIAGMQGRLICNLLDGMVAVEGGLATPEGPVYNDLPDRISDTLVLIGAGYGLVAWPWAASLGWLAAVLALLTAYIRLLGGSCGLAQRFSGPMAKQHRMAVLTVACAAAVLVPVYGQWIVLVALVVVALGSAYTCARRLRGVIGELRQQKGDA